MSRAFLIKKVIILLDWHWCIYIDLVQRLYVTSFNIYYTQPTWRGSGFCASIFPILGVYTDRSVYRQLLTIEVLDWLTLVAMKTGETYFNPICARNVLKISVLHRNGFHIASNGRNSWNCLFYTSLQKIIYFLFTTTNILDKKNDIRY